MMHPKNIRPFRLLQVQFFTKTLNLHMHQPFKSSTQYHPMGDSKSIIHAAKIGDNQTIIELYAKDPTLVHSAHKRKTPMYKAITNNHPETVRTLLELDSKLANIRIPIGDMPLRIAICQDYPAVVQVLIAFGAVLYDSVSKSTKTIDHPDPNESTPLHEAVIHSTNTDIIELLIRHGSDAMDKKDRWGFTPLELAYVFQSPQLKTMLILSSEQCVNKHRLCCKENRTEPVIWSDKEARQIRYRVFFSHSLVNHLLYWPLQQAIDCT
jgi:ankyrin repeat protein